MVGQKAMTVQSQRGQMGSPGPPRLSSQMALDASMVRARSARIGMFAEAIGAIVAYCGRPWWRRIGL
jgi:hypothetical protein